MLSASLSTSDGQYLLVSIIEKQYVLDTFTTILTSITNIINLVVYIVAGAFAIITVLVFLQMRQLQYKLQGL